MQISPAELFIYTNMIPVQNFYRGYWDLAEIGKISRDCKESPRSWNLASQNLTKSLTEISVKILQEAGASAHHFTQHAYITPPSFLGLVNMKSKAESMLAIFIAALWMKPLRNKFNYM